MKKILLCLLIAACCAVPFLAPRAEAKPLRLFLIGNSFSQNATQHLPQLSREGGHELTIGRAEASGHSLQQHWQGVEANDADPTKGKIYGGKSLRELLSAGTWDVVTIQQASFSSGNIDSYRPYAEKLRDFIKKLQPQAEVVLHQTWTYRSDAAKFAAIGGGQTAATDREMWEKTTVAYRTIAAELGVRLIPTGDAFWRVGSNPQWAYKKDLRFDFAKPVFPNLPDQTNSLHAGYQWKEQTKLELDANHASEAGKFLASLVWYGFLFNESPEKSKVVPGGVPANFAPYLREVAAQALQFAPLGVPTYTASAVVAPPKMESPTAPRPVAASSSNANPSLTTGQGGADTSVRGGEMSSRAFGSMDILRVRNSVNAISSRKAYLRFDVSQLAAMKTAKSATLNLTMAPAEGASPADRVWTFQVFGLKDGNAGEDWNEGATSWDNAPANDTASTSGLTDQATSLGTFTVTGKGEEGATVSFSSADLLRFLQGDTNGKATLIITRKETGDSQADNVVHIFASKENTKFAAPGLSLDN